MRISAKIKKTTNMSVRNEYFVSLNDVKYIWFLAIFLIGSKKYDIMGGTLVILKFLSALKKKLLLFDPCFKLKKTLWNLLKFLDIFFWFKNKVI